MKKIFVLIIRFYQLCISPLIGNCCKFVPSCSEYTLQAINKHGVFSGSWLGVKRIAKCNPWCSCSGRDDVP